MAESENKTRKTTSKSTSTSRSKATSTNPSDLTQTKPARKTPSATTTRRRTTTTRRAKESDEAVANTPETPPAPALPWYRIDLHMHTPASHDYEQPEMGYIAILRQAEKRGLSIIAFTDHNTVYGYRNMKREIADLEMLERLDRIRPDELGKLTEYRRLLKKILVLPGFEFTATFGFHILGIFAPDKPIRDIESILMQLKVPGQALDLGLSEAGATSDVLTAYRMISDGGGLAIAAHANSTNGVSMRDMDFGGQTRIAYTQDQYLHAIEWTDLDRGRRSSSTLLTGIRQEYARRMHALQGSDAHRITVSPANPKRLGIGERPTEVQLAEVSFAGLKALLQSQEWDRVRPVFDILDLPAESLAVVVEPSEGLTQAYHAALGKKVSDRFGAVVKDVCAMLNCSGGTIVLGAEAPIVVSEPPVKPTRSTKLAKVAPKRKIPGIKAPNEVAEELGEAIQTQIYPVPQGVTILEDVMGEVSILRVTLPPSKTAPHVIDEVCYLRENTETRIAKRDEIVAMIKKVLEAELAVSRIPTSNPAAMAATAHARASNAPSHRNAPQYANGSNGNVSPPRNANAPAPREITHDRAQSAPIQPQRAPRDTQFNQLPPPATNTRPQPAVTRAPMPPRRRDDAPVVPRVDNDDVPMLPVALPAVAETNVKVVAVAPTLPPPTGVNAPSELLSGPISRAAQTVILPIAAPREVLPKSGVEIALMEAREDMDYYAVRDMRNGGVTRNVTIKSARDLWHYAILKYNSGAYDPDKITWQGDRAVLGRAERAGKIRYDLALRTNNGVVHVFYGVVMDGLDVTWKALMSAQNAVFESSKAADADIADETAMDSLDSPVEVLSVETGDNAEAAQTAVGELPEVFAPVAEANAAEDVAEAAPIDAPTAEETPAA